jgi:hypothetical protein
MGGETCCVHASTRWSLPLHARWQYYGFWGKIVNARTGRVPAMVVWMLRPMTNVSAFQRRSDSSAGHVIFFIDTIGDEE